MSPYNLVEQIFEDATPTFEGSRLLGTFTGELPHKDDYIRVGSRRYLVLSVERFFDRRKIESRSEVTVRDVTGPAPCYTSGDKVFVLTERCLATVLNVYGDGINGDCGEIRLDVCGNTSVTDFEPYDPIRHAEFDFTFKPILRAWKEHYGITQDIPLRD